MPGFQGISRATFPGFPITLKSCETPTWGQTHKHVPLFSNFFKTSDFQEFKLIRSREISENENFCALEVHLKCDRTTNGQTGGLGDSRSKMRPRFNNEDNARKYRRHIEEDSSHHKRVWTILKRKLKLILLPFPISLTDWKRKYCDGESPLVMVMELPADSGSPKSLASSPATPRTSSKFIFEAKCMILIKYQPNQDHNCWPPAHPRCQSGPRIQNLPPSCSTANNWVKLSQIEWPTIESTSIPVQQQLELVFTSAEGASGSISFSCNCWLRPADVRLGAFVKKIVGYFYFK